MSRPPAENDASDGLPNELLLPVMDALRAEGALATLLEFMCSSKTAYEMGIRVLYSHISIGGENAEWGVAFLDGHRREHAMVRSVALVVPAARPVTEDDIDEHVQLWFDVLGTLLEKLTGLEALVLDLAECPSIPEPLNTQRFGSSSLPPRIRRLALSTGPGRSYAARVVLKALERHAQSGVLASWSFSGSVALLSMCPSALPRLRHLTVPESHSQRDMLVPFDQGSYITSAFSNLRSFAVRRQNGRAVEPFLPLLEDAPHLERWAMLTPGHDSGGLPDLYGFPRTASLLHTVRFRAQGASWDLLTTPGYRPRRLALPSGSFPALRGELAERGWLRELELFHDADGPWLSPPGVARIALGRLPAGLEVLQVDATFEMGDGCGPGWFAARVGRALGGKRLPFELRVVEGTAPRTRDVRPRDPERVWRWNGERGEFVPCGSATVTWL
ncbi:hypothetical protein DFJ74DRAFT_375148 [Hyaloraphidium curvatum]|nr:hypothetical protein DFJ74DRAFT_375148 [Hyaloraphidium curvatum]